MLAEDNLSISDLKTKQKVSDCSGAYTLSTSQIAVNISLGPCAILLCNSTIEEA